MTFRARFRSLARRTLALGTCLLVASSLAASAAVVRLAPDFSFPGAGNRSKSLRSLRGQPVVIVFADTPDNRAYRKQLKNLREIYSQFASRNVVFVAAFKNGSTEPVLSNVPFAIANNGAGVSGAYGVTTDFSMVIVGKDGNVDYQTDRPAPAQRIRDVIQNSFVVQDQARKDTVR